MKLDFHLILGLYKQKPHKIKELEALKDLKKSYNIIASGNLTINNWILNKIREDRI
ncbi:MAG: hypothetical protein ACFFD2_07070 [Promethearchaeota archaeon]